VEQRIFGITGRHRQVVDQHVKNGLGGKLYENILTDKIPFILGQFSVFGPTFNPIKLFFAK